MIMQPPPDYAPPKKRFPRQTFKGIAGLTIALGIACVLVSVGEIIHSAKQAHSCWEWGWEGGYPMDDVVYPDDEVMIPRDYEMEEQREEQWREKRSSHHRRGKGSHSSDHDSSSSEDGDMEWLADATDHLDMATRCRIFNCVSVFAAMVIMGCAVIFIVTGSLGVGAARTRVGHRQSGLKTGYIVMNILVVLGFAPTVFIVAHVMARAAPAVLGKDDIYTGHVVTHQMMSLFGLAQTVLCLVAASVSCCCAPTTEHVKLITMAAAPIPMHMEEVPPLVMDEKLGHEDPAMYHDHVQLVQNEATEA